MSSDPVLDRLKVALRVAFDADIREKLIDEFFVEALAANDRRALQKFVDKFLADIRVEGDPQRNFQSIEDWIATHDCVRSVESSPDLIDTEPPIKQFIVTLDGRDEPVAIGIALARDHWRFNMK